MLTGIPLHQLSQPAPPRPPDMHLLDLLFLRPPQLAADHPLPHRLFARFDPVFLTPRYSAAKVGPNPSYTGMDKTFTAFSSIASSILRLDGFPRDRKSVV